MKRLDLGCGYNLTHGFIQNAVKVDIKEGYADVIHDLNSFPYPFSSDEFDEIHLNHSEYYIKDKKKLMAEIHRIAKPGAKVVIRSIHASRWNARRTTGSHPFFVDIKAFHKFKPRFEPKTIRLHYFPWQSRGWKSTIGRMIDFFANMDLGFCERVWCYFVGGFDEIYAELEVKK